MLCRRMAGVWLVAALVLVAGAGVLADTLYLRNGNQVRGRLVSIRNGELEFRQEGGGSARTIRVDIADVRRIDFDDEYSGGTSDSGWGAQNDAQRPRGMRERIVVVSADVDFVDTGIDVRSGQSIYLVASGQVRWGPNRKDGPAGEKNSPVNEGRPMPNRAAAALIGRVGAYSEDVFFIGDEQGPIRLRATGRLFLGINDDFRDDNSGNFRVTVYYYTEAHVR